MALPVGGLVGRFLGTTVATGAGFAFGRAAGPVLAPPIQALRNEVNEQYPFVPLSPEAAAAAALVGAEVPGGYAKEAARSGIGAQRFAALREMTGSAPGWETLRTLWNRGRISAEQVDRGLAQQGIRGEWRDDLRALRWIVPSAQELAQMAARGVIEYGGARDLAADVNANAETFDRFYRLALGAPDSGQLLDLRNRGAISDDQLRAGLRKNGLSPEWAGEVEALRRHLLPPSDVIRLAVHEVYSPTRRAALNLDAEFPAEFAQRAAQVGISEGDARDLWAGHWDLPSATQGAQMMFRGEISAADYDGLLAALDYAPTWRDKLRNIARRIPTMTDFQRLARREVYNPTQRQQLGLDAEFPEAFAAKAALHGMSEQDARDLWAGGWRLPSATQGYRMLWRNEIDELGLDRLLKALDYAPTWREKLANIARPPIGRVDLRRMLAGGILTEAQAVAGYKRLGYTDTDARNLVKLATTKTSETVRELTAQQLTSEFEGGYIAEADYVRELDALGFTPEDAARYRRLGEARKIAAARKQTLATIRSAYVSHRLQEGEARERLDALGLAAEARDRIWAEWQAQEAANVRVLTPAQIRKLYSNAVLTAEEAIAELELRGFSRRSAESMLKL